MQKPHLERNDLKLMICQLKVYEDHLEIQLQADVDALIRSDTLEDVVNFKPGTENSETTLLQSSRNHGGQGFPSPCYQRRRGRYLLQQDSSYPTKVPKY